VRRRSRREVQQRAASRRLRALHEAGHAYAAGKLGVRVRHISLWRNGKTVTAPIGDEVTAAVVVWAGVVAEALDRDGPQRPESWTLQPDAVHLRRLRPTVSAVGYERAVAALLGDPDAAAAVQALADVLLRRRLLFGFEVRRIIRNPSRYPPRPPRRRGKRPPPDYVRRSMASPDWGDE
jgi:hypothetical protein